MRTQVIALAIGTNVMSPPSQRGRLTMVVAQHGHRSRNDQFVPPYQEPRVPASECPGKRNQLNAQALRTGSYPITRNLFVIVKQNGQADQQAGEAYANWLLTQESQELIEKAGFVRIK